MPPGGLALGDAANGAVAAASAHASPAPSHASLRLLIASLPFPLLFAPQGGHYIAYVRAKDGNWYLCDDSLVVRVNEDAVRGSQAYMIFYGHSNTLAAVANHECPG